MGLPAALRDRSLEATWTDKRGSAAEAAKPRPRGGERRRKRVLRDARWREVVEDEEVVGRREREVGDAAEAIVGRRCFRERKGRQMNGREEWRRGLVYVEGKIEGD